MRQKTKKHGFKRWIIKVLIIVICLNFLNCSPKERLYKKTFIISGTFVEVTSPYKNASGIASSTMKKLEKIFSLYDKESQLSKVNKSAGLAPVKVSEEFIELLKLSKQLYEITDGAFDPSIGKVILYWKEKMKNVQLNDFPDVKEIKKILELKGFDFVLINEEDSTVFINKKGIVLDLGGVAKGYMVDKAIMELKRNSIYSALINAGGDIFCLGKNGKRPWHIGVRNPKVITGILDTLAIVDEAVATSGDYEQFFKYNGKTYSHIINPKTGFPVENQTRSVTVIAHNATTADGLSTAFFIMGEKQTQEFLFRNRSNLKVLFADEVEGKLSLHWLGPPS